MHVRLLRKDSKMAAQSTISPSDLPRHLSSDPRRLDVSLRSDCDEAHSTPPSSERTNPNKALERVCIDTIQLPFATGPDFAPTFLTIAVDDCDGRITGYSLEVGQPTESAIGRLRNCLSNAFPEVEVRND
jgi:hypothetical protein